MEKTKSGMEVVNPRQGSLPPAVAFCTCLACRDTWVGKPHSWSQQGWQRGRSQDALQAFVPATFPDSSLTEAREKSTWLSSYCNLGYSSQAHPIRGLSRSGLLSLFSRGHGNGLGTHLEPSGRSARETERESEREREKKKKRKTWHAEDKKTTIYSECLWFPMFWLVVLLSAIHSEARSSAKCFEFRTWMDITKSVRIRTTGRIAPTYARCHLWWVGSCQSVRPWDVILSSLRFLHRISTGSRHRHESATAGSFRTLSLHQSCVSSSCLFFFWGGGGFGSKTKTRQKCPWKMSIWKLTERPNSPTKCPLNGSYSTRIFVVNWYPLTFIRRFVSATVVQDVPPSLQSTQIGR